MHDGVGWSPSVKISDAQPGPRAWPQAAALPDGRALAVWTEEGPKGAVLMTSLREASGKWGTPEPATNPQRLVGKPEVVVHGSIVRVVYNGYTDLNGSGYNEMVLVSRDFGDAGSAWSAPEPLSREGENAWGGSLAIDDGGVLHVRYVVGADLENNSMAALPDLEVARGGLALAATPPVPGAANAVETQIVNRGLAASGATTVSLYDGDPAAGGTLLVQGSLPALAIGQSTTVSLPWTPELAGRYALYVVVDDQALISLYS